jgi:hypothetical protein
MNSALAQCVRSWALIGLASIVLQPGTLRADPIAVRHKEGTFHGFLVLRTMEGKEIAVGDLIQVTKGDRVVSRMVFRFKDGSVDDETTIFTQDRTFRVVSDHHVQKGPSFPRPMDVTIDASSGEVTVRSTKNGKKKVESHHLDLPPDLANGLITTILKNIRPDAKETKVSFLAATPKPRLVKLAITPQGKDTFSAAGAPHTATHYVVKVELGWLAGFVARLLRKQPKPIHVWIVGGAAPAFVRMEGPLYQGGPVRRIELTAPFGTSRNIPAPN